MKTWLMIAVILVAVWILACRMVVPVDSAPGQPTPTAVLTPTLDEYIWLPLVMFSKVTPTPTAIPTHPPTYPTPLPSATPPLPSATPPLPSATPTSS